MAPVESDHDVKGAPLRCGTGRKGAGVSEGRRSLRQPRGLHVCKDGSLLVADSANFCVVRFKPGDFRGKIVAGEEGRRLEDIDYLKDLDKPGPVPGPAGEGVLLKQPGDVCEDMDGNLLVLDTESCRLQNYRKGSRAETLVPPANGPIQKSLHVPEAIKNPRSFTVCKDGALLICDTWSHRVLRYGKAAEKPEVVAGTSNSFGARPEKLSFPSSAAVGPDGALFVADTNNHRVQRFAPGATEGSEATTVAGSQTGETGSGLDGLNMPTGLCIDPHDGALYVADRGNARVLRFVASSRAGDPGEVVVGPDTVKRPWGLSLDVTRGTLYVSDEQQGVVVTAQVAEPRGGAEDTEARYAHEAEEVQEEVEEVSVPLVEEVHVPAPAEEPPALPAAMPPSVKGSPDELD